MPRAPLTPEEKRITGKRSKAKPRQPGTVVAGRPRMPKTLSEIATARWRELVRILRQRGVLTKGDGPLIELCATTYERWQQCLTEIRDNGMMVETTWSDSDGNVHTKRVLNPCAKMATTLESQMRQQLRELCSTVASRNSTAPAPLADKDKQLPPDSVGAMFPTAVEELKNNEQEQGEEDDFDIDEEDTEI